MISGCWVAGAPGALLPALLISKALLEGRGQSPEEGMGEQWGKCVADAGQTLLCPPGTLPALTHCSWALGGGD